MEKISAVLAGDALLNEAMILLMDFSIKHGKDALVAKRNCLCCWCRWNDRWSS